MRLNKRLWKTVCAVLCFFLVGGGIWFKAEELGAATDHMKREIRLLQSNRGMEKVSIHPFKDEGQAWYLNKLISHGGGGMDGCLDTLNCLEGLEQSVHAGYQIIEVDFKITSDRRLILAHDWQLVPSKNILTYDEFMGQNICDTYTPVSAEMLIEFMRQNPNVFIVTDTKDSNLDVIRLLTECAGADKQILKNIIVQIYHASEYAEVKQVYPYENFIYTLYKENVDESRFPDIVKFCLESNIRVVTLPKAYVKDARELKAFKEKNIKVFVHTVNQIPEMKSYIEKGVQGVYTDFIEPSKLVYLKYYDEE